MSIKDAIKVFGINIICIFFMILGIKGCQRFSSSVVLLSLFIVIVIVVLIADLYTNIRIFSKKEPKLPEDISDRELEARVDKCINKGGNYLKNQAISMKRQLDTFEKRRKVLSELLTQYFSEDDDLYAYTNLIEQAQRTIRGNMISAMNRIAIFDEREYGLLVRNQGSYSASIRKSKIEQYEEHLSYIDKMIDSNDRLLIEFDNLITEVSRINDSEGDNDLSELRDTVNAMKQLHFNEEDDEMKQLMGKY